MKKNKAGSKIKILIITTSEIWFSVLFILLCDYIKPLNWILDNYIFLAMFIILSVFLPYILWFFVKNKI